MSTISRILGAVSTILRTRRYSNASVSSEARAKKHNPTTITSLLLGVYRTVRRIHRTICHVLRALLFIPDTNLIWISAYLLPPGYTSLFITGTTLTLLNTNRLIRRAGLPPGSTYRTIISIFLVLALTALITLTTGIRRTDIIPAIKIVACLRRISCKENSENEKNRAKYYLKKTRFFH